MLTSTTASSSWRSTPYLTAVPLTSGTTMAIFGLVITATATSVPPSRTATRNGVSPGGVNGYHEGIYRVYVVCALGAQDEQYLD